MRAENPQKAASEATSTDGASAVDVHKSLHELVDLLSPHECRHLLASVTKITLGERFWEDDAAIFYNEYVKARYATYTRHPETLGGGDPISKDGIYAPIPIEKSFRSAKRIALPPPGELDQTLRDVLLSRRSRRDESAVALSLEQLSTLLHYGYGTTGHVAAYGFNAVPLRTAPSSGGLQSAELYFFAQHVEGLEPGLYHFNCSGHAVELLKPGYDASVMRGWVPGQPQCADAALIFVFAGCYDRLRWKYGARSYRYMCMDIGFVCENLYLVAEAMGLAFCAVAGFIEDELETYLEIDGQGEMALLVAGLGPRTSLGPQD